MATDAAPPPSSNAFARRRDEHLRWLLRQHPATAGMLVEIGLFPSVTRARKRLRRLVERKRLRLAGTVWLKDGRPEQVFACGGLHVKADNLVHEVQLSRLCFKLHADEVRRGSAETDPFLRPDAELWIGGWRFLLEFDAGTMSPQAVVRTRFAKYQACPDFMLWVCTTEVRRERLRRVAEGIRETALFTTLEEAVQDPHAAIWMDVDGERVALPRGGGGAEGGA